MRHSITRRVVVGAFPNPNDPRLFVPLEDVIFGVLIDARPIMASRGSYPRFQWYRELRMTLGAEMEVPHLGGRGNVIRDVHMGLAPGAWGLAAVDVEDNLAHMDEAGRPVSKAGGAFYTRPWRQSERRHPAMAHDVLFEGSPAAERYMALQEQLFEDDLPGLGVYGPLNVDEALPAYVGNGIRIPGYGPEAGDRKRRLTLIGDRQLPGHVVSEGSLSVWRQAPPGLAVDGFEHGDPVYKLRDATVAKMRLQHYLQHVGGVVDVNSSFWGFQNQLESGHPLAKENSAGLCWSAHSFTYDLWWTPFHRRPAHRAERQEQPEAATSRSQSREAVSV